MGKRKVDRLSYSDAKDLLQVAIGGNLQSFSPYKKLSFPKRDSFVIEIAGIPRSYKSTLTLNSVYNFRVNSLTSWFVEERSIGINKRVYPAYYSLALAHLTTRTLLAEKARDITFLDRGIYDQLAFLHVYRTLGKITPEDFKLTSEYLVSMYGDQAHALIICQNAPGVSMRREGERKTPGYVMNREFLTLLRKAYKQLPLLVSETRAKRGMVNIPFPIVELDSTSAWKEYSQNFLKTTGTFYHLNSLTN